MLQALWLSLCPVTLGAQMGPFLTFRVESNVNFTVCLKGNCQPLQTVGGPTQWGMSSGRWVGARSWRTLLGDRVKQGVWLL